jgi:hypothetical protein
VKLESVVNHRMYKITSGHTRFLTVNFPYSTNDVDEYNPRFSRLRNRNRGFLACCATYFGCCKSTFRLSQ